MKVGGLLAPTLRLPAFIPLSSQVHAPVAGAADNSLRLRRTERGAVPAPRMSCHTGEATMTARLWQGLCAASIVLWTGNAGAVDPIGGDKVNVATQIDLFKVNRGNFADMVTPVAKKENGSELILYDSADHFCDLMAEKAAAFTKDTGIPVKHVCVEGDAATQRVIAAKQAGQPAPVDVFFGPNGQVRAMTL